MYYIEMLDLLSHEDYRKIRLSKLDCSKTIGMIS